MLFPQEYIESCIENLSENDGPVLPSLTFPDVPIDAWFTPSICAAWENGIVSGYPDGRFRPEEGVRFVEAAKMLALGFGLTGMELPNFGDANTEWYRPYVEFLSAQNAIPLSITDLAQPINRGEMAEFLYRLKGFPLAAPPTPLRTSKNTESVTYPVEWKAYRSDPYTFAFSYPNVWPDPLPFPRGQYDGRNPYYRSAWTVYFGPKGTKECAGGGECVARDMWIDGYSVEDSAVILSNIEQDDVFMEVEDENLINGIPALILLEEVGNCIDKRSFHFGKQWIYSITMRCGGQDEKLYRLFEQIVTTLKETDARPPEHRAK